MRYVGQALRRLGRTPKVFLLAPIVAGVLLAYSYTFTARQGISMRVILRDTASAAEAPFYYGCLANLADLIWVAGAAACLLAFACLRGSRDREIRRDGRFLLFAGLLTAFLVFDDMFLFHEFIAPGVFQLTENEVFFGYAVAALIIAVRFRRSLARTNVLMLLGALVLFAASLAEDLWPSAWPEPASASKRTLLEDGPKFVGIVAWTAYLLQTCLEALRRWRAQEQRAETHSPAAMPPSAD